MPITRRAILLPLMGLGLAGQDIPSPLTVDQIVGRLVQADENRVTALGGYTVRIPAMSIGRSDGMSITIPGDVDNALGAKRRR